MRKLKFANKEYYHVFNRGNNKRVIFNDLFDVNRFLQGLHFFNCQEPIGSIYEKSFQKDDKFLGNSFGGLASKSQKLVDILCYCLNPNHFHLVLKQKEDYGIQKFMHRIGTGYTMYFNEKYKSSGSLFQGPYKAIHVDSNDYLLHLSAYVNLNSEAHKKNSLDDKFVLSRSSWNEYTNAPGNKKSICEKEIVLSQFRNPSEYKKFAQEALITIKEHKDLQGLFLEGF